MGTKKILFVFTFILFLGIVASLSQGQETSGPSRSDSGQAPGGGSMHGQGMAGHSMMAGKHKGMGMMGPMMLNAMMPRSMISTEDGKIIVLAGNKLIKYDSDLNLVKEQTIHLDISGMQDLMKRMAENCPICAQTSEASGGKTQ